MAEEEKFTADDEEIGATLPSEKNWKGIIIAILVIAFVIGLIVLSIFIVTPPDTGPRIKGERLRLDQILHDDFVIDEFNGTWISGQEFVFRDPTGGLSIFNAISLNSRMLVPNVTFSQLNVERFNVSADLNYVLFSQRVATLHSYSFTARYYIYDVTNLNAKPLTHRPEDRGHPPLVYAKFGPVGSALIIVDRDCNIFYKQNSSTKEIFQITTSGLAGVIHNGAPNWVYETEIFGDRYASWFAPDGHSLAYATFNDSMIDQVPIVNYGIDKQYPTLTHLRYPKAGQNNPQVSLWVVDLTSTDLNSPKVRDVKPPDGVKEQLVTSYLWDHYLTALTWVDNETLCIVWMNRVQNVSVITICKPPMYYCEATHTETAHHGWVDLYEAPVFSADGQGFLVRLPVRNGNRGEFTHVNLYNMRLHIVNPMTHGSYEVTEILGWDHENNFIFFMGTTEQNAGDRHLYRIPAMSSAVARMPDCLSCFEPDNSTDKCFYNKAHMSKDFSYFVLECLGPDVPRTYLYSTWDLSDRYIINNYDGLRDLMSTTALPQMKTFKVELEGDASYTAQVQLLLPPGLREEETITYPMVVHAHGRPGHQSVDSRVKFHYGTYLASQKDIIYALIDGRGSGFQGDKLKHELFLNLGNKEVMDQLAVIRYLKDNLHFIDEDRIIIYGNNYGGYVSTMAMAKDATDMLRCGIAISPITRWEHYDSIFTERYMGSPHVHPGSNYKGYEAADVTKVAGNLKSSKFLLIHGTADKDVHYHHSMMLSKALIREGVIFKQISYPDEGNALEGVRKHLYKAIDKFLADCFRPSVTEMFEYIKQKKDIDELSYV